MFLALIEPFVVDCACGSMSLPANNKVIFLFCGNVGTPIIEDLTLHLVPAISSDSKIQGDGRKFLDRFKFIFGHKYHHNRSQRSLRRFAVPVVRL